MQRMWMLILWLSSLPVLWGQGTGTSSFDVAVTHYDLELQVDARYRSVAGTQRMTLRLHAASSGVAFLLSDSLRLVHVKWRGERLQVFRRGDTVQVQFGRVLKAGTVPELEILYGGRPPAAAGVWGDNQVALDANLLPPHHWWPCLPGRVDSMRLHIIYPQEQSVLTSGQLYARALRPGRFLRRSFRFAYALTPSQVRLYAGRLTQVERIYQSPTGERQRLHCVAPVRQAAAAEAQLIRLSQYLAWLETHLGPYPFWDQPFYWMGQDEAQEAPLGLDEAMLRRLASHWLGRHLRPDDDLATRILHALCAYLPLWYLETQYDQQTAVRYLLDQPEVPAGAGMWFTLRQQWADDAAWWRDLRTLSTQWGGRTATGPELVAFLSEQLGRDLTPVFEQYLLYAQPPTLQYRLLKARRSTTLFYRWQTEVETLPLEVLLRVNNQPQMLQPSREWQQVEYKKTAPRDFEFDREQGHLRWQKL